MEEEAPSIEVKPINSGCQNATKSTVVTPPNSTSGQNNQAIQQMEQQQIKDTQYDTIDQAPEIKPLTGGKKKKVNDNLYKLDFCNKIYTIYGSSPRNALELFFEKKNYKKDIFVNIWKKTLNNKRSDSKLFLIRGIYSKNRIISK